MAENSKIVVGLKDALAHARGDTSRARTSEVEVPRQIDVRALRNRLKMSQEEFAQSFNVSVATLRNWEQGHRRPEGTARVLLTLIERIPDQVQKALQEQVV